MFHIHFVESFPLMLLFVVLATSRLCDLSIERFKPLPLRTGHWDLLLISTSRNNFCLYRDHVMNYDHMGDSHNGGTNAGRRSGESSGLQASFEFLELDC